MAEDARGLEQESSEQELLSLDEAAAALGVSRSTLNRWMNEGRVRGFKVGRQWRFRRTDLDKFGQMSHPSAAGVNVAEVEALVQQLRESFPEFGEVSITPELTTYPNTEEEKAVDRLFETVVVGPMLASASDIHIAPGREEAVVSQRIDGVLHAVARLPRAVHRALVACIKLHADMVVEQEQIAQDGRFTVSRQGAGCDLRAAAIPSLYGESVTLRLMPRESFLVGLDRIGMSAQDQERYLRALVQPTGLVICSGPTGSGKTTVLYSGLQRILSPEKQIYSVEDPVEITLEGVTQIPVNRRTGMTLEYILRTLVHHDPDVLVVTDIASREAGEICLQAGLTGHLVLSTVHANSAAGTLTRLLDLGLDPFLLAQSLICVIGTRLARRVCSECGRPDEPTEEMLAPYVEAARKGGYELPAQPTFRKGAGCEHCRGTGYRGRTGLFEVLEGSDEIYRLILNREPAQLIQEAAVRNGMTTLVADGIRKAAEGVTTVFEAVRVTRDLAM